MFDLLALPRASWKVRLVFAVLSAIVVNVAVQQWPHRHDDLAIARWMAWFLVASSVFYLPRLLVVVIFGRLPGIYAGLLRGVNRTLPQIRDDLAREQHEQRERSREL